MMPPVHACAQGPDMLLGERQSRVLVAGLWLSPGKIICARHC